MLSCQLLWRLRSPVYSSDYSDFESWIQYRAEFWSHLGKWTLNCDVRKYWKLHSQLNYLQHRILDTSQIWFSWWLKTNVQWKPYFWCTVFPRLSEIRTVFLLKPWLCFVKYGPRNVELFWCSFWQPIELNTFSNKSVELQDSSHFREDKSRKRVTWHIEGWFRFATFEPLNFEKAFTNKTQKYVTVLFCSIYAHLLWIVFKQRFFLCSLLLKDRFWQSL